MKLKILYSLISILLCSNIYATDIELKTIKDSLLCFLQKTEPLCNKSVSKGLLNDFIWDTRSDKPIQERRNGVFLFYMMTQMHLHFVLIDDTGFEIINMREALDENMKKLISYFKRSGDYTKEDMLFYISDIIRIYNYNKKLDSREGPIL